MHEMFENCNKLTTIYVSESFNTASLETTYDIFCICYNLVGGNGTTYNKNIESDITYVRIDKEGEPGLLTLKTV